jgi:type II restriction/modification system DNA methylase subunit YeeA
VTPDQFISKWQAVELTERAASQSHFIDLCRLLDEPSPSDADPKGEWYAFERGATKTTGGNGWADVWKRGHFGWEYKGRHKDLDAAFVQLQQYALALENPPLLVVCDLNKFRLHTNWTNSVSVTHTFDLNDLRNANVRQKLKWVLSDPERLKPGQTRQMLTEEAAAEFAKLAQRLRGRGRPAEQVAHFINRLVFCMFAEDVDLLPNKMFKRMLDEARAEPSEFEAVASDLFRTMKSGGRLGLERVAWFNGSLFNDDTAIPMDAGDVAIATNAARLDWGEIDPSILGTLFERGLDPDKRTQLGAHYTDREKILAIIDAVVLAPLLAEWDVAKGNIGAAFAKADAAKSASARTKARGQAAAIYRAFLDRLRRFRVLDPACGSGNFLYLALRALKDIEHRVGIEAETMGLPREFPQIGPASVQGIEINPYAAELARVSVWIGEIQWMRHNGFNVSSNPILKPLDTIECRDAIMADDGSEAEWPEADVVIGNPPFLGDRRMIGVLGEPYSEALRRLWEGKVPRGADLVCYWFEAARALLAAGRIARFGLVATNSIRAGQNRVVLDRLLQDCSIYEAWNDEEWTIDGADVRVSLICATKDPIPRVRLNGVASSSIRSDLTANSIDLTRARRLAQNARKCVHGSKKIGPFDIDGETARKWLLAPLNVNGRPNSDVLFPLVNGADVAGRNGDRWIVDFGMTMSESDAAFYALPFEYVKEVVWPERRNNRNPALVERWWLHGGPRPALRNALPNLKRCIATPAVTKHRIFVWIEKPILPDAQLMVTLRDDDTTFGILHSRFHTAWTLGLCSWLGVGNDPRYTPSTTFGTFPFPDGLTPDASPEDFATDPRATAIATAAKLLHQQREAWLNPANLVTRAPEVVAGYPDRIVPINNQAAETLRERTLTNLYNEPPSWLVNVHRQLDEAVAAAYGWPPTISEEEFLARLLEMNLARAAKGL